MNNFLRVIFSILIIFFTLILTPCKGYCVSYITPNTQSFSYLTQTRGEVTLVQGDENYYVVSQNKTNSEITNTNKNHNSSLIFGEDAITEDNILKHYIFNRENLHKNRAYHKISPTLKNTIYTRAP